MNPKTVQAEEKKEKDLPIKQKLFVYEYLISRNATDAAIKAGYSKKTARTIGSRLLSKGGIRNLIDK